MTYTWANITTADTGEAIDVTELDDPKTFHVVGAGTAQRRRSNNNVDFVADGAAMAANSVNDLTSSAKFIDLSPIATATVTVIMHARNPISPHRL